MSDWPTASESNAYRALGWTNGGGDLFSGLLACPDCGASVYAPNIAKHIGWHDDPQPNRQRGPASTQAGPGLNRQQRG